MICIIAEKPSVAKDIARIVGATENKKNYVEGNGYIVTWAFGHLVGLAMPEDYGFERNELPMLPSPFRLVVRSVIKGGKRQEDSSAKAQLEVIRSCFDRSEKIIVATDAGREGELIFRYIYDWLKCTKPYERLWISSLTDKAIREGLSQLKPGQNYDNLYYAGKCRSESDWIVGLNASRALSQKSGQGASLGRVQTPTLALICRRYLENKNFKTSYYYRLAATVANGGSFRACGTENFEKKETAVQQLEKVRDAGKLRVISSERKKSKIQSPLLHDLTSLQKEANRKLGMSADRTLQIAQSLYEKKVTTYPRTGSQYISDDVYETVPELLEKGSSIFPEYASVSRELSSSTLNRRSVNALKVTDHHALLITGVAPGKLSDDERAVYNMIWTRMLESFSEECVKDNLSVRFDGAGNEFVFRASKTLSPGWKAVLNEKEEKEGDDEEQEMPELPVFTEGQEYEVTDSAVTEHQTKPKPIHTEASLLAAMENAGREVEDEEAAKAMKDCGIGTPATRAQMIETLLKRDYIKRVKKQLHPTEKGLQVYELVRDFRIADVAMTGEWEKMLTQIEDGLCRTDSFEKGIVDYTNAIIEQISNSKIKMENNNNFQTYVCPKCGRETFRIFKGVGKCTDESCDFKIFRKMCGKSLTDQNIIELIQKKRSSLIKGFVSKAGKKFDAYAVIKDDWTVGFEFQKKK